mmetsp:Transcript_31953/g.55923  ORF Transcript_31953/g.55923 Transcript_31953/m.55923 type:complete len:108 (-) Transcript_31953:66-389(-)
MMYRFLSEKDQRVTKYDVCSRRLSDRWDRAGVCVRQTGTKVVSTCNPNYLLAGGSEVAERWWFRAGGSTESEVERAIDISLAILLLPVRLLAASAISLSSWICCRST